MRLKRSVAVAIVCVALAVGLEAAPASAATRVPCSVTALQTAVTNANASGGSLQLAPLCVYTVLTPATGSEAFPVITAHVAIFGGKGTIIRRDPSAAAFRLFTVGSGGVLTLEQLGLQNGSTSGLGGAVEVQSMGALHAIHDTISNNVATNGGGVHIASGALGVIRSSRVFGNQATGVGGAGALVSGRLTVVDSVFYSNSAPINGGAINVQPGGTTKVENSLFEHNTSGGQGGALSSLGKLIVNDSTIRLNVAGAPGGAIAAGNSNNVVLSNDVIVKNKPTNCSPKTIKGCKG